MHQPLLTLSVLMLVAAGGCFENITGPTFDQTVPRDYIQDTEYKHWLIEVDYVQGHRPANAWLDTLETRMEEVVRKQTVTIQIGEAIPGKSRWTDADIQTANKQHQDRQRTSDTVVTHVLYLDGEYQKASVYGIAYDWDLVAIFTEAIATGCDESLLCVGNEDRVQRAVLVHEFGHILGLVNRGIDMVVDREGSGDQAHHSTNRNSVMYWAVNNAGVLGLSSVPERFDENDKRDIACAGGKGDC